MKLASIARFALRAGVAAVGLALAFRLAMPAGETSVAERLASAWTAGAGEALAWFGVALLALGIAFGLGALRFQLLLRGAGLTGHFGSLLRAYLVAGFFNLVLPGLILGDVYRLYDARRDAGRGAEVLGLVVLERLLGFSALGCVALLAAPALPLWSGNRDAAWALCGLSAAIAIAPLAPLHPRGRAVALALTRRVPWPSLSVAGARALEAVARAGDRPGIVPRAFALSLANQGLPVAAVAALAQPLDSPVGLAWFAVVVPYVTLASLVPISIGGTGVRETLFVLLFGAVGMRPEVALALSLSTLAAALAWGFVGLALFALGRQDRATP